MIRIFIILLLMLNAFMVYKLFWTSEGFFHLKEIKQSYYDLEHKNQKLIEENKELSRQIMALRDDEEYIMESVRKEMRYVRENEVIYFFPEKK
ncbi:MAG: septum formation initiator family protein [Desulfonatronovibrio sp.]